MSEESGSDVMREDEKCKRESRMRMTDRKTTKCRKILTHVKQIRHLLTDASDILTAVF